MNHTSINKSQLNTEEVKNKALTSFLLMFVFSIHAVFEGLAIGLQKTTDKFLYMVLAIVLHKWVEALSIGINMSNLDDKNFYLIGYIILFSAMTPFGILIGMIFSGVSPFFEGVFMAISAGNNIIILYYKYYIINSIN